jgi:Leucine-rich repeat (LRR) protein
MCLPHPQAAPTLIKLDLSNNPCSCLAPEQLATLSRLRSLDLSHMALAAWPLPNAHAALPQLTSLNVRNNPMQRLPDAGLVACPGLRELDMSGACLAGLHGG